MGTTWLTKKEFLLWWCNPPFTMRHVQKVNDNTMGLQKGNLLWGIHVPHIRKPDSSQGALEAYFCTHKQQTSLNAFLPFSTWKGVAVTLGEESFGLGICFKANQPKQSTNMTLYPHLNLSPLQGLPMQHNIDKTKKCKLLQNAQVKRNAPQA